MAKICIDISNVVPGKGGSGGGMVTYAAHIAEIFDTIKNTNDSIIVLKHKDFDILKKPQNLKVKEINLNTKNFLFRIYFVHFFLPIYCLKNKIDLLYRVTPELPFIKVCKYACTLPDFMFDFYLEQPRFRKYLSISGKLKFFFFRIITRHAEKLADLVLVFSETLKKEVLRKMNGMEKKVCVTLLATDFQNIQAEHSQKENNDGILKIGVIAGLYPHKGHFLVLKLAEKLINLGFSEFAIVFRGNPAFINYKTEIENRIIQMGLTKNVYFVEYDFKSTLSDIYSSFNIFLLLSEYEGFGLPVLEAQAYNKPVFCSNIPILKEVLQDSAMFLNIFNEDLDVNLFLNSVKNLAQREKMILAGKENLKRFSWQKMCLEMHHSFMQTINNRRQE